jgi:TIR domain
MSDEGRTAMVAEPVELLDAIGIDHESGERRIELYVGDLTALPPTEAVDVLVVSAFPDTYDPWPGTLIEALAKKGIAVSELAERKAVDLRQTCSCWLSDELAVEDPEIQFKRILCFEPLSRGAPAEVVGDIFRSLLPFLGDGGVKTVAMPVVASGNAHVPVSEILPPLVEAAVHWMSLGVSLQRLKIFVPRDPVGREEAEALFADLKRNHEPARLTAKQDFAYDIFVSYAHQDGDDVEFIAEQLSEVDSRLRLYLDRQRLDPGSAWQYELFDALDSSRKVVVVYSPSYVQSKVCKEEFNIAWARSRDADEKVLFPLYLYTATLPTYMKMIQYVDCREGSRALMRSACERVITAIDD